MSRSLVFLILFTFVFGRNLKNSIRTSMYSVQYDIDMVDEPIVSISSSDTILKSGKDVLIFESASKYFPGTIIASEMHNDFLGKIVNCTNNVYTSIRIPFYQAIQRGKLSIVPSSNAMSDQFCFGWNVNQDCKTPRSSIPLFNNKGMDVQCDNCFIGFSGTSFIDIDFGLFKIDSIQSGFKNLNLYFGAGVSVVSDSSWSYLYEKSYVYTFDVITFYIGLIKVHVYVDIPIRVHFNANANIRSQIRFGDTSHIQMGNLYFDYTSGDSKIVKSSPIFTNEIYITSTTNGIGNSIFRLTPSINLYVNDVARFSTTFNPEIQSSLESLVENRKVCIDSKYQVMVDADGEIIGFPIGPKTLFDTGLIPIGTMCKTI